MAMNGAVSRPAARLAKKGAVSMPAAGVLHNWLRRAL